MIEIQLSAGRFQYVNIKEDVFKEIDAGELEKAKALAKQLREEDEERLFNCQHKHSQTLEAKSGTVYRECKVCGAQQYANTSWESGAAKTTWSSWRYIVSKG